MLAWTATFGWARRTPIGSEVVNPSEFHSWQRKLSENAPQSEGPSQGNPARERELEREIEQLRAKLAMKDTIIAKISEECVQLKLAMDAPEGHPRRSLSKSGSS
jgi:hypothetical protein